MLRLRRTILSTLVVALALAGGAQASVKAGSKTVTAGTVTATLSWKGSSDLVAQKAHIKIDRSGSPSFSADLADACDVCQYLAVPSDSLHVTDVDGDGEPEVLVDTYTGGAHCCSSVVVYWFDGTSYSDTVNDWGDGSYKLQDLDKDGTPEFLSDDDRFAYAFAAYAFSWRPPLIDDFVGHKFVDVTRRFPAVVRADIRSIDRARPGARKEGDDRGLIAARMADLALLGQQSKIRPYLAKALRNGWLTGESIWPRGRKYQPALLKFLKKTGYLK